MDKTFLELVYIISVFSSCCALNNERNPFQRVVEGERASIDEYPYVVSILYKGKHVCGGGIISPNYVLTSAHCLSRKLTQRFSIRYGSSCLYKGGTFRKISLILPHPDFNVSSTYNDIGIMRVKSPMNLDEEDILPLKLPKKDQKLTIGAIMKIAGWGKLTSDENISDRLQSISVPILGEKDICAKYHPGEKLSSTIFCAGYEEGKRDSCQGDSGGPAVIGYTVIGIVSWSSECAAPGKPGMYTSVAKFVEFIEKNTDVKSKEL